MPKKVKPKAGRVDMQDLMRLVNKKAGRNVAHDLTGDNPTSVKEWIPTGSRWLDSIICKGQVAGIPVGKVTEIAGLESTVSLIWPHRSPQTPRNRASLWYILIPNQQSTQVF